MYGCFLTIKYGSKRGDTCAQPFHGKRVGIVGWQVMKLTTERRYQNCGR